MITLNIDNFDGKLTRKSNGSMDSGLAKYASTYGNDPFSNPGSLTWLESPVQIDPNASVITDLIVAMKTRLESGITYVYAIGHLGRLYKIQVNSPSTHNPNYDNPVLLATLSINSPTFKYGASIQFFGATEKIYIGHDLGVTSINYNGSGEAFVGTLGSYTANVPRPSAQFVGKIYFGNGANILEIDSTATVTTYAKLSPAFPPGTYTRDMDVSSDGNYLKIVVSRLLPPDVTLGTQDTTSLSSGDSYLMSWNGSDTGVTSYTPFNSYSLTSNTTFSRFEYLMGYDLGGAAIYSGTDKVVSLPNALSPNYAAAFSTGNLFGFAAPETVSSQLKGAIMVYGQYDEEMPKGLFRLLRFSATSPETDVVQIPACAIVSNLFYGSSSAGYSNNQVGSAKLYFSTIETSSAPTTKYRFYKFTTVPTGIGTAIGGVYETQSMYLIRLFRNILHQAFKFEEIRLYTFPLVANNSFKIEITGSDGTVIPNSSKTFTVGTNANAGDTLVMYTPPIKSSAALGLRITNLGTVNWTAIKAEADIDEAGK